MREYETTFIVQPEISEEGSQAILTKLDGILESGAATRLMCEDHGKRKLAYEIRKFHKGHYYTLQFLNDGKVVPELERTLRLEESVLRFLTILADDEVADVDARKAVATEAELEQTKRAAERAQREAEEAATRREQEESERQAALSQAEAAAAAAAGADESAEQVSDETAAAAPKAEEAPSAEETPSAEKAPGEAETPTADAEEEKS